MPEPLTEIVRRAQDQAEALDSTLREVVLANGPDWSRSDDNMVHARDQAQAHVAALKALEQLAQLVRQRAGREPPAQPARGPGRAGKVLRGGLGSGAPARRRRL